MPPTADLIWAFPVQPTTNPNKSVWSLTLKVSSKPVNTNQTCIAHVLVYLIYRYANVLSLIINEYWLWIIAKVCKYVTREAYYQSFIESLYGLVCFIANKCELGWHQK